MVKLIVKFHQVAQKLLVKLPVLVIHLLCFYQFIDLSIDYLNYNHVIKVNLIKATQNLSFTICVKKSLFIKNKWKITEQMKLPSRQTGKLHNCLQNIVCPMYDFIRIKKDEICFTYLYQATIEGIQKSDTRFLLFKIKKVSIIFHTPNNPSHGEFLRYLNA